MQKWYLLMIAVASIEIARRETVAAGYDRRDCGANVSLAN
jgi:hypothetical protein